MARTRYKFNPESLSFDRVTLGLGAMLLRFTAFLVGSLMLAVVYWVIFAAFFDSPEEKALKRELTQMSIQYDLINREMGDMEVVLSHLQQTDDNLYRAIFNADPLPVSYRQGGVGGLNRYKDLEGFDNSEVVVETARRLDNLRKRIYSQSKSFDALIALTKEKEEMVRCIPAIMPISNRDLTRTASGYGPRVHPYYKIIKFHTGMDFTAPSGTDVYATGDGVISDIIKSSRGYGNHIVVDHGFGYSSLYAHLDGFNVKKGQKVQRGEVIGFVGNTGMSLAPHLHYEVKLNGRTVDPVNYYFNDLSPDEYERMIDLAAKTGQSFD
ncbi:MAG: M23 family metallopeptidase [Bacteroidales bacterium]|nr:M23 family metallopeptidase [Bacteroidales bacterium]